MIDVLTGQILNVDERKLVCEVMTDDGRRLFPVQILKAMGINKNVGAIAIPNVGDHYLIFLDQRYDKAYLGPPLSNEEIKENLEEFKLLPGDLLIYNNGAYIKVYRGRVLVLGTTVAERIFCEDSISDKCVSYYLHTGGGMIKWVCDDETDKTDFIASFATSFAGKEEVRFEIGDKANVFKAKIANLEIEVSKDSNVVIKNNQYECKIDNLGNLSINALKIEEKSETIANIKANATIEINANGSIMVKAPSVLIGLSPVGAVVTNMTHPVCYVTGLPIIGLPNVLAG